MIFKTKKYWIGVAVFWTPWVILWALGYFFALQPQAQKYRILHQEFADSNDRVSIARMSSLKETKQRQADLLEELNARISEFLVLPEQQDRIVFEISRLANTFTLDDYAGKNRQDVWGADEKEEIKIQRMWMTITFKSSFQQFAAFLNAMERNTPVVFVESASIERSRESSKGSRAKLLISFFTQPEEKPDDTTVSAVNKAKEGSSS